MKTKVLNTGKSYWLNHEQVYLIMEAIEALECDWAEGGNGHPDLESLLKIKKKFGFMDVLPTDYIITKGSK